MSYLDPRGGYAFSAGDRTSDSDRPISGAHGAPDEAESDPYREYRRRPASLEDVQLGRHSGVGEAAPDGGAASQHGTGAVPNWAALTAATEVVPKRGPGRRRAGHAAKPTGRAGRNMPMAIAVGVGMGLIVLASLFTVPEAFLAVIAVATLLGTWELARALRTGGAHPPLIPLLGGGLAICGLAWWSGPDAMALGVVATVLAAVVWRIADGRAALRRDVTASVLITVYVPFLLGFGALLFKEPDGNLTVIAALLAVTLSDTGGFAAGVFYGKHKMAPSISPGKTWEGFAGSVVAAALGSALYLYFALDVPVYFGLFFGAVIAPVAVVGDLAESMLKRDLKIKDMSSLLPGHGGLMDRLDSILFAVPTAYLLLALITSQR